MSRCGNPPGKSCTLHINGVKVNAPLRRVSEEINFDNLVIFSWPFKHKLRDWVTVRLALSPHLPGHHDVNLACLNAVRRAPGAGFFAGRRYAARFDEEQGRMKLDVQIARRGEAIAEILSTFQTIQRTSGTVYDPIAGESHPICHSAMRSNATGVARFPR
jgi:hypothetical protein